MNLNLQQIILHIYSQMSFISNSKGEFHSTDKHGQLLTERLWLEGKNPITLHSLCQSEITSAERVGIKASPIERHLYCIKLDISKITHFSVYQV